MRNTIVESEMPFIADNAFHIEKSLAYMNLGIGNKSGGREVLRCKAGHHCEPAD